MRKHKSVVAILLAVMMIFTFMPAMAFATDADGLEWKTGFKTATYNGHELTADWVFGSDGQTVATVKYNNATVGTAYFYDFTGATLALSNNMDKNTYDALDKTNATVNMVRPEGATGPATASVTDFKNWGITYSVDKSVKSGNAEVKAVIASKGAAGTTYKGTEANKSVYFGTIATKSVVVDENAAADPAFYEVVDGNKVTKTSGVVETYDGKEHTIVAGAIAKYDFTKYQKWDTATASWVDANGITWKDAAAKVTYRAVYTIKDPTKVTDTMQYNKYATFEITVDKRGALTASVDWANGNTTWRSGHTYDVTATQAENPRQFVTITNTLNTTSGGVKVTEDVEEFTAVFDELYTVKVTKNAVSENQQTWTIVPKATGSEWTALVDASVKAHKTLFANYGALENYFRTTLAAAKKNVTVVVSDNPVVDTKDDDITFSGQTKYVYSGKKTTKKGVLKAKKTIKVNAVADSGNAMTFTATKTSNSKITVNATTGAITVKKGLKKGTYKVTVKAKTAAGNGYKAAKATQTYTIVIKK